MRFGYAEPPHWEDIKQFVQTVELKASATIAVEIAIVQSVKEDSEKCG